MNKHKQLTMVKLPTLFMDPIQNLISCNNYIFYIVILGPIYVERKKIFTYHSVYKYIDIKGTLQVQIYQVENI